MAEPHDYSERVPYGSAYDVGNLAAQDALRTAAIVALDEALAAFADVSHSYEMSRLAQDHPDEESRQVFARHVERMSPDPTMVSERLPEVYRERYVTLDFLKNWSVTVALVGWKLAQAKALPLTSTSEELALHLLIEDAVGALKDRAPENTEAVEQLEDLYESAFEDDDFLALYSFDSADFDADQEVASGRDYLRFENWFFAFGSGVDRGVPHPFLLDGAAHT